MNLILLREDDFLAEISHSLDEPGERRVRLQGRRLEHVTEIHRAKVGDELVVGLEDGLIGRGRLLSLGPDEATLAVTLDSPPPPPLPLTLVLALPRPRVLRRCLQAAASLGVKDVILSNAWRVEKSYWQTPVLEPETLRHHLTLGLEQARDTHMPRVTMRKLFKPFVEDELPVLTAGRRALVAHPLATAPCPGPTTEPTLLAIGPEGGWIPYEIEKLTAAGCTPIQLGPRILRSEVALTALLAKLF